MVDIVVKNDSKKLATLGKTLEVCFLMYFDELNSNLKSISPQKIPDHEISKLLCLEGGQQPETENLSHVFWLHCQAAGFVIL